MKYLILIIISIFFAFKSYSISIDETIKSTVSNNQKIKIGLEKINESKQLIIKASGELLPDIEGSVTGTYTTSESSTSTSTTEDDTFADTYKLTITKNLYDAGFNNLEIKRSKILYENEIINFKITVQDLIMDAIEGYLTVMNYEKSLKATQKNFESVSKALAEVKTKFELGSSTLYDLQNAESSYAISKANLFSSEQNLKIGRKSFKRISGEYAKNLEDVININKNLDYKTLVDNMNNNNLYLKLISNDIENKQILLLKEKSTKKANLDLTGTAQYSDTDRIDDGTESTKGTLSLTLTIPIFQQGIDESNIKKYLSQLLQAELNLENERDDLEIQLSNAYKDFLINESKMIATNSTIKSIETLLDGYNQEYEMGTKTISEVLTEEENLLTNKVSFFNAKKDYLISYFMIKSIDGSLFKDFEKFLPELN